MYIKKKLNKIFDVIEEDLILKIVEIKVRDIV